MLLLVVRASPSEHPLDFIPGPNIFYRAWLLCVCRISLVEHLIDTIPRVDGGENSPNDISRGMFAGEVGVPRLLKIFNKYKLKVWHLSFKNQKPHLYLRRRGSFLVIL
jgi:hypothetical protein